MPLYFSKYLTRSSHLTFQQTKAKAEALKKPSQPKASKEGEKKSVEEGSSTTTAITSNTTTTDKTAKTKSRADKEQKRKEKDKEKDDKDKKLSSRPSLAQQPVSDFILIKTLPEVADWFPDQKRTPVTVLRGKAISLNLKIEMIPHDLVVYYQTFLHAKNQVVKTKSRVGKPKRSKRCSKPDLTCTETQ